MEKRLISRVRVEISAQNHDCANAGTTPEVYYAEEGCFKMEETMKVFVNVAGMVLTTLLSLNVRREGEISRHTSRG